MHKVICLISSLCGVLSDIVPGEYGNEDRMYHISPDQHLQTPRLEDFFWTGSGDGPPPPASRPQPSAPLDVTVATTTVIATVYLDAFPPQAVTDQTTGDCLHNCEDVAPEGLVPEIPDDRRYWLLTVIQGATPDSLQMRLARLYQKAFIRQQEKHLGIIKSLDAPQSRKKHEVHSFTIRKSNELSNVNAVIVAPEMQSATISIKVQNSSNRMPKIYTDGIEMYPADFEVDNISEINPTVSKVESWILATPVFMEKRAIADEDTGLEDMDEDKGMDQPLEDMSNETLVFKREILKPEQQPPVHVHIQNVTEESDSGSVQIVYVVLVGGRAVPATVAARDMRLVRDAEVAMELGAAVNIKAEPYLKEAEGLEGSASVSPGIHGTELWALGVGTSIAVLLLLALAVILCMAHSRKKAEKSSSSLRAYRDEMIREIERNRIKEVHDEKDGKLISVVSPSRTRPSSSLLPVFRKNSSTSSTSSGISEVTTVTAIRKRQKKSHPLRMPQKKRVGTTDSLLEAAGLDSSDSGQQSVPQTPTSYLSMPSIASFPRGNIVEPLSRILEPVSVSHLDLDSPVSSPKDIRPKTGDPKVPRRQMASQLVRLGSIDKDPGVIGPLVWDLHCQRIKDGKGLLSLNLDTKISSLQDARPKIREAKVPRRQMASQLVRLSSIDKDPGVIGPPLVWDLHCQRIKIASSKPTSPMKSGVTRMRQRFNELVDDTFTLFGSTGGSDSHDTYNVDSGEKQATAEQSNIIQARNDNVRLPGSPYGALEIVRGSSAGPGRSNTPLSRGVRPLTSAPRARPVERRAPARAWGTTTPQQPLTRDVPTVNPAIILSTARLPPSDPAVSLIQDIQTEIKRVRDNAKPPS